jgi:hypothetical protein
VSTVLPENSAASPLSVEHHQALALANERLKKVRRAAGVASFNGWVTSFFAICSALIMLVSFGVVSVLITIGLIVVAVNEFRGRKQVLRLNPRGLTLLGWNQTFFMSIIVVYCAWQIYRGLAGPNPFDDPEVRPVLEQMYSLGKEDLELMKDLATFLICLIYGLVIILTVIFQGGNAIYYFRRRRMLTQYLSETPEWIVQVQRVSA